MKQDGFFIQVLVAIGLLFFFSNLSAQVKSSERCNCNLPIYKLTKECQAKCLRVNAGQTSYSLDDDDDDDDKIEVQEIIIHDNISVGTGNPHGNENPFLMRVGPGKIPFFGIGKQGGIRLGTAMFPEQSGEINLGSNKRPFRQVFALKFAEISDRREKENIVTLPYGLKDVMQLKPVTFTWKKNSIEGRQVGLIAQEVEEIIPEIITRQNFMNPHTGRATDRLSVSYSELIPVLIHAIQEQQAIIETQKQQLGEQTNAISSLETTVSQLIETLQSQGIQTQKAKDNTSDAK